MFAPLVDLVGTVSLSAEASAKGVGPAMCNLYSMTKGQTAILNVVRATLDKTGNLPPLPGIYPDYPAPIVRQLDGECTLAMARWGMPSPGPPTEALADAGASLPRPLHRL